MEIITIAVVPVWLSLVIVGVGRNAKYGLCALCCTMMFLHLSWASFFSRQKVRAASYGAAASPFHCSPLRIIMIMVYLYESPRRYWFIIYGVRGHGRFAFKGISDAAGHEIFARVRRLGLDSYHLQDNSEHEKLIPVKKFFFCIFCVYTYSVFNFATITFDTYFAVFCLCCACARVFTARLNCELIFCWFNADYRCYYYSNS